MTLVKPISVGSLCTGYGGIEMGLRLAGLDLDVRWVAEVEPALDALHGDARNLGDITRVDWIGHPMPESVDLITAGFPCQPTSAAGRQLGDADPRWLWPHVFRAVAMLAPERVLLENVRNLVSYEKGRLWAGILDDLASLGYGVRWLTLGACHVGAAHHRHRVFALATHGGTDIERVSTSFCGARAGLLPTPTAREGDPHGRGEGGEYYWQRRQDAGRTNGMPLGAAVRLLPPTQPQHWGRFAQAINRHADLYGEPPAATEPNRNGAPHLAPAFAEWLMCLPAGHVTSKLDRGPALRAIGNGVCPPQLAAAWELLA